MISPGLLQSSALPCRCLNGQPLADGVQQLHLAVEMHQLRVIRLHQDTLPSGLPAALEEDMPEGLRMIKVHSFEYVMFGTDEFDRGDVFIVPASEEADFVKDLLPVEGDQPAKVYDAAAGKGVATDYIQYGDEDYYMYLGSGSVHLEDGAALAVARAILAMG